MFFLKDCWEGKPFEEARHPQAVGSRRRCGVAEVWGPAMLSREGDVRVHGKKSRMLGWLRVGTEARSELLAGTAWCCGLLYMGRD